MIKIVCVNLDLPPIWNGLFLPEIGKIYDAVEHNGGLAKGYLIKVGSIDNYWIPANLFITLAEWRDKQINSILDE